MRRMRHGVRLESALTSLSRPTALASRRPTFNALASLTRCRYSSTTTYPERIAVLGGGVAGLSTAYFVSREFPKSKITIYEAGADIGGWIKSRKVAVDGGEVIFELGPRTLRNATPTAHLIQELGLIGEVTYTMKDEPAAKNRYIYYPDRLNKLPSATPSISELVALWRSGILAGTFGMLTEPMASKRPYSLEDETIGSFLARRVDSRVANNIVSAVFHGIYAGDIWQLSAKTLLSMAWQLEGKYGSALGGFLKLQSESPEPVALTLAHPYDIDIARAVNEEIDLDVDFAKKLAGASTFTFKGGLQTLVDKLKETVIKTGNVDVQVDSPVQSSKPVGDGSSQVAVTTGPSTNPSTTPFDLVLSSLRHPPLTPYVTVMTVSLFYPTDPSSPSSSPTVPPGFGYLIPQSVPFAQNPERALGVIFDSHATKGQDTVPGTKLTVMMGGHWWDDWSAYPTPSEGLEMAQSVLARHLNITSPPAAHLVNLSRDCIPQYTIGYESRLRAYAHDITSEFGGRYRVVGNQVNGVGVNDCITGAWNLARGLRGEGWRDRSCGLGRVVDGRGWEVRGGREMGYRGGKEE